MDGYVLSRSVRITDINSSKIISFSLALMKKLVPYAWLSSGALKVGDNDYASPFSYNYSRLYAYTKSVFVKKPGQSNSNQ